MDETLLDWMGRINTRKQFTVPGRGNEVQSPRPAWMLEGTEMERRLPGVEGRGEGRRNGQLMRTEVLCCKMREF